MKEHSVLNSPSPLWGEKMKEHSVLNSPSPLWGEGRGEGQQQIYFASASALAFSSSCC